MHPPDSLYSLPVKTRVLRREHAFIVIPAMLFAVGLIAVNAVWPAAFTVFIAIGGVTGALMVLYEVGLTKRIAQAEFIRELQTGFTSNHNIEELWRKLLLREEITAKDRPLVSGYLTFFETLHLLVERGAIDFSLTDDLFRNRFFTAIGNKGILDTALISEAGAFANIHDLIETWHQHLLNNDIPIHWGYYSYIRALTEAKGFQIVDLTPSDLPALLRLQDRVLEGLGDEPWLRANTEVMLKECLAEHVTLGARRGDELVAAAVLYDAGTGSESIKHYVSEDEAELTQSINLKLVLTLPEHRRAGLGRTLIELLERRATELDKREILCTVHPKNAPSKALFGRLGYDRVGRASTPYGKRDVYARRLPTLKKRWAR